jgi:hypothetical protein
MKNMWNGFFPAVEKMRECQKEYIRTNTPSAKNAAKKYEMQVYAFIRIRRAELEQKKQPGIFQEGKNYE